MHGSAFSSSRFRDARNPLINPLHCWNGGVGDHPPCSRPGASRQGRAGVTTQGPLQYDPSVAKTACPVCPSYEQQGQGDKLVGSSSNFPRLLHRDDMTMRGYLAGLTAKIQYNA